MDREDVVGAYGRAWEETDDDARRKLLAAAWADDGLYCDRMARTNGRDGLDALIKGFQAQIPGYSVAITSGLDGHNEFARFAWEIRHADGSLIVDGTDYVTFDADGRIARLVGFSGDLPPL